MALLNLSDEIVAKYLLQGMANEIERLRQELAKRSPSATYRDVWSPARRRRQSEAQKAAWVRRRAAKAALGNGLATPPDELKEVEAFLNNSGGNGHSTEAWI